MDYSGDDVVLEDILYGDRYARRELCLLARWNMRNAGLSSSDRVFFEASVVIKGDGNGAEPFSRYATLLQLQQ